MILDLKDNIVVVDGQPYSAIEVYITAKTTGKLVFNKLHGIQGRLEISGPTDIYYQDPGILIINSETPQSYSEKLEVVDTRKNIIAKTKTKKWELSEFNAVIDNYPVALTIAFNPRKLLISYNSSMIQIIEKPFLLQVVLKAL